MSLLLVFSILWLRVKCYDLFLIMHIALALVILVCLFYHTKIFLGEFDGFLWPCVAFWAFDRVCRIARVLAFLIKTKMTKISVGYSKEDEIIRIDVTNIFFELKWTASGGTHFFLL